ncbi:hypothetical protein [Microbacterium indicum]|uniref:hypothetical protein n=1 Tax=Microbacterium indicum TaxID=358100 RepID=UPI0004200589|nr:hypothetical protein [Microbacterium indicum]
MTDTSSDLGEQALLWCLLPEFDVQLARPRAPRRLAARVGSRVVPGSLRPFPATRFEKWGGGLVATRSPNEERALAPILGRDPLAQPLTTTSRPGSASRAAAPVRRRIDAFLAARGRPELRASWHHAANMTAAEIACLARTDLSSHDFVLISRQTHPLMRALILAAERDGVPTVYVPHSPLTRFQADLPVTHALMRGAAERDWIAAQAGADAERIAVVGNPATAITSLPAPTLAEPCVLAVSPDAEPTLRGHIALAADAGLTDVVVAPHPRSDLAVLSRLVPASWTIDGAGRTISLLERGPRFVLQASSGVAWESASLGIPTGDLRLAGRAPDYPFLDSVIPALGSPDDVAAFAASAATTDRDALRAHAAAWCASDGSDAVAAARSALAGLPAARGRITDLWAPGGSFRAGSALAGL